MQADPFFSGAGLDRADALRSNPEALKGLAARSDARQLRWKDGLPALDEAGRLAWEPVADAALFLGLDQGSPRYSAVEPVAFGALAAFPLMAILDAHDAPLFAAALSLGRWHGRHRYCANCGQPSEIVRGGWSRRCPYCDTEHYPRVDPVVIMLAQHDGRLLLGRQPHYPPGRYSALAGFVEVGETIEAAVARELFEEAGIHVDNVTYVASQPWPFPSSLMVGCKAMAKGDLLTIDTSELEDARWFSRDEIIAALGNDPEATFQPPPQTAIARTLLERWLAA